MCRRCITRRSTPICWLSSYRAQCSCFLEGQQLQLQGRPGARANRRHSASAVSCLLRYMWRDSVRTNRSVMEGVQSAPQHDCLLLRGREKQREEAL